MNYGFAVHLTTPNRLKWPVHGLICVGDFMRGKHAQAVGKPSKNVLF
jgi:hypothetical protein